VRQPQNDKNNPHPGNLDKSLDPVHQTVNPRIHPQIAEYVSTSTEDLLVQGLWRLPHAPLEQCPREKWQ
ncbi:hypothetical protein CRM22_001949, partial [Opisthorchis felineus]